MEDRKQVRALEPLTRVCDRSFVPVLPGSKSFSNRALLLAAQRPGETLVSNALRAEDTTLLAQCLNCFGGLSTREVDNGVVVTREASKLKAPHDPLFIGGAGTPARFLLSFMADADGDSVLTGIDRLCERPMGHLLEALGSLGIKYDCLNGSGCLPVRMYGGQSLGNAWEVEGSASSQFVSSLLLHAGRRPNGVAPITVSVRNGLVSRPYVEMTAQIMREVGLPVEQIAPCAWRVSPGIPKTSRIVIEPDASAMSYFLGAAAVTKSKVTIPDIGSGSKQGDVRFAQVLEAMGCEVTIGRDQIELKGRPLTGIEVDMEVMPDTVLTLAAVAATASGPTRITNIANLRIKECDRIHAAAAELTRLGVPVAEGEDWLEVRPADATVPARIETYNDHRVAMAFALLGLKHPGIEISAPACVAKSFPTFWDEYERFKRFHDKDGETIYETVF